MITAAANPDATTQRGRWDSAYHAPVMVAEVLRFLGGAGHVLDGTVGGGGHAAALLDSGCRVTGIDRDPGAIAAARDRLADFQKDGRFRAFVANFSAVAGIDELSAERFDGALLDLGVSSSQFDDDARGFSFRQGTTLDMRMGPDAELTAAEWLASAEEREITRVLRENADEPRAGRMAREIVRRRARSTLVTSDDLVGAIRAVLGARSGPPDFARVFQALRIEINDELSRLAGALLDFRERLAPAGTMVVISYHSGEDRIVKHAFREWSAACTCAPRAPVCVCGGVAAGELLTKRALTASDDETARNARARSARLRAWRKAA